MSTGSRFWKVWKYAKDYQTEYGSWPTVWRTSVDLGETKFYVKNAFDDLTRRNFMRPTDKPRSALEVWKEKYFNTWGRAPSAKELKHEAPK